MRGLLNWLVRGIACAGLLLLGGCNMTLLDPKGLVGMEQKNLIITALALMLIVVIPVIVMTFWFAWRYRASNKAATYAPNWSHSNKIEAVVWGIPCVIILVLGTITWKTTHSLDPRAPLPSAVKPLEIEVVSLDWKWLFIYPEQGVASVNEVVFPVNVPVHFKVTSGSVMNSFFIPQLGSQIYAMAGMRNQLNLMANEVGSYKGISANYSGHGFSGMKFTAEATTQEGFEQWLHNVRTEKSALNFADYLVLAKPTENHPVTHFSTVETGIYDRIIAQFMPVMAHHDEATSGAMMAGKEKHMEQKEHQMMDEAEDGHQMHEMHEHSESGE
ncbi:MAG: ubiquinol oxidase subunit II [Aeromonadaceae bacterium]